MKNKMILISGMGATGKTTFAKWLSEELHVPHICYDNILKKILKIARSSCENDEQVNKFYGKFPYEIFWFNCEEIMKSSLIFIIDYHFNDMVKSTLDELTAKYQYETVTVHMDCPAELAYMRWNERNHKDHANGDSERMRPDFSEEAFINASKGNKDFRYGNHFIYVDTADFSKISYNDIAMNIREYLS